MQNQCFKQGQYTGIIEDRVAINGGLVTRTYYTPNSNPHWHYHENLHIVFVFQNGLSQTKHLSTYTDKKGNITCFHAGEVHRYLSDEPLSKSANIELSSWFLKKYDFSEEAIFDNIKKQKAAKSIMLNIQSELISKDVNLRENILALLLEFISKPNSISLSTPKWIILLEELLHDNWNRDYSLDQLSEILNIHPVTISKHFKKYFGCTLGRYRRKIRIEKSIDLIKYSGWSLSEIAHYCGFSDQSHFIRNFKAQTNLLPNFYKKL